MLDSIADWFSVNVGPLMEQLDNQTLIEHMTSPIGLGVFIALMVFCLIMKWRISFVVLASILSGIYVVRYTITDTSGPNKTMYMFIGAAIALAAFVIYFSLMRDD